MAAKKKAEDLLAEISILVKKENLANEEIRMLDGKILEAMRKIGAAAGTPLAALHTGPATRVLKILHENPERAYSPSDLARILGLRSEDERNALRLLLGRMARDGRARRVAHGRYCASRPREPKPKEKWG
jgi:hypothetical protein